MTGFVGIVLHAHLPYVRHPEHARPLEERWLHEALWESYLPLIDVLDRLGRDGVAANVTVSVSPPLAAMWCDDLLKRRFEDHLARLDHLAAREAARPSTEAWAARLLDFYRVRIERARATWDRIDGDPLGALASMRRAGLIELWTSSATHAYLPGLARARPSIRAQIRLGAAAFRALSGAAATGMWLPECAFDPSLDADLRRGGVRCSVLDGHGLELARPRPPCGVAAPVLSPQGVAYFGRDPGSSEDVWSRRTGYPGHASYREFYRDVGFDLPEASLAGELGPFGTRLMTGLKLHRITGSAAKEPYDPGRAEEQARAHAADFVARREARLSSLAAEVPAPVLVAPFDAELFGHWWFEGPIFLEHVLRGLAASARRGDAAATTLGAYLAEHAELAVCEPAASSWGEGGYGEVWTGHEAARLWRHVHHAERRVLAALDGRRDASDVRGRALDQAIRELLLLQASDFAFMLHRREMSEYAEARVRTHVRNVDRCCEIAGLDEIREPEARWVAEARSRNPFLTCLDGQALRSAFDPW
jgi:1,4-alpha-glucan branching enzyme